MPPTRTEKIAYHLFAQVVVLLMLYSAAALLSAVKFLPTDPLARSLPFHHAAALADALLHLAVLTGLLGGGVYAAAHTRADRRLVNEPLLHTAASLWTGLLALTFAAGLLGSLVTDTLLLDVLRVVVIVIVVGVVTASVDAYKPVVLVWSIGLWLSAACTFIVLRTTTDYLHDAALRALMGGLNQNVAYVLATVALGYWLMHRFSNVTLSWVEPSLLSAAGLLALAGTLLTLASLYPLDTEGWPGTLAAVSAPAIYLVFAAHSYRALSDRNPTATLAAHWYALGLVLFLSGPGLLGGVLALPAVRQWTAGTRLAGLQATLTLFACLAVVMGVINQVAAELHGVNGRVTGLMPFWLVAFGTIGGASALAGAGVGQVYMERVLGVGYLETQALLVPLYAGWIFGLVVAALGVALYALGFWYRRPVERMG
jgi:nitric oxide reductase subunit B